jgi:pentatricopeptide repeat protein
MLSRFICLREFTLKRMFSHEKQTAFNQAMKGKSNKTSKVSSSRSAVAVSDSLPSIFEREKMRKLVVADRPASFYEDFYSRLVADLKHVNSIAWMHEKEKQWLFSKCNPSIESPQNANATLNSEDSDSLPVEFNLQNSLIKSCLTKNEIPDITSINLLLNSFANEGNIEKMNQLMLEMTQQYFISPNVPTLSLLLKGYSYAGKVDLALLLFDRLREAGAKSHQIVYIWMMEGLLAANMHTKLMEFYWEAKQVSPANNNLCALAIRSCGKNSEVEKAFLVYEELLNTGIRPNDVLLTSLLYACCQRKDYYPEAFEIVKQLESYGYSASLQVYNDLLLGCAKNSDLKTGCKVWEELNKTSKPTATSVTHILYVLASVETLETKGSTSEFVYAISPEEIVAKAREIYSDWLLKIKARPNSNILSAFLAVLTKNRQTTLAKSIFYDEHAHWNLARHPNSYESMFQLYESTKDFKSALELRKEALEAKIPLTFCAQLALISTAALVGEIELGLELVREIIMSGQKPFYYQVSKLTKAAKDAERDDIVQELVLICKSNHVSGSSQRIFAQRNLFLNSLLDDVYGPERGRKKERSKSGMRKDEEKKLVNVGLYKEIISQNNN